MIEKKRLEELIEQGAIVYYVANNEICQLELTYKHNIYLTVEGYYICLYGNSGLQIYGDKLFESKVEAEDAEFISKYHTTKTYKFEPPTWREFLATRNESQFAHWSCGDMCIVMVEENNEKGILKTYNQFEVDIFNDYDCKSRKFDYCIIQSYGIDTREETYYKALEYAQKLFLGEK